MRIKSAGFTTTELLVTLFIAVAFIAVFYQLFVTINQTNSEARDQSNASSLAYATLKNYYTTAYPGWFNCNTDSDLTANPSAPGQLISTLSLTEADGITLPATQTVKAFAPFGCGDKQPVKIEVTLTYGNPEKTVVHSQLIGGSERNQLCPSGFIEVPGNIKFGTTDFCVMKYEAKNVNGIAVSQASGLPWVSIPQTTNTSNHALSKTSPSPLLTDGSTATSPYYYFSPNSGLQSVTVDLGSAYTIDTVKVWHYYADSRTYNATKTEVSTDGSTWSTVFDSAVSGTYSESSSGRTTSFYPRGVRYIRDWLNGSNVNAGNHWVEIQAYTNTSAIKSAAEACQGCHLITEAEWLTIAHNVLNVPSNWSGGAVGSGYIYSGHNDNSPSGALAASSSDTDGYYGTGNSGTSNQRRTLTLSNGEVIWDMSGNVHDMISQTIAGNAQPGISGESTYSGKEWNNTSLSLRGMSEMVLPSYGTPAAATWSSSNGLGQLFSNYSETATRSFFRGGSWGSGVYAGIYTLNLQNDPANMYSSVGFRAAR